MLLSEVLQLPEKTWTPDVNPVMATLTVVGDYTSQTTPFPQFVQQVQLKDDSNASSEVKIQTKFEKGLMAPNMVGRKACWRLKWYQGGQKQVIVGYCLDKMGEATQAQPATQQPAQAASQPAQRPIASSTPQLRDYDAENRGKCRFGIVCAYISAGVDPDIPTVDYWVEYSMTGQVPLPPAKQQAGDLLGKPTKLGSASYEGDDRPWES